MRSSLPYVSIGLPVYNGENFLEEAINSILPQTFEDFELIISDNASTDRTQEICKGYAAKDHRIRYYRNQQNVGAASNYNRVFELSTGKYFKWAAHDDLCAPVLIERCLEVLDSEPSVVICYARTSIIDEHGSHKRDYDDLMDLRSPKPHERFRDYLFRPTGLCNAIFGVVRASELRMTPLIGSYIASDMVLLGELVLRGKIYELPERLFYRRRHPERGEPANPTRSALAAWYDPANRKKFVWSTEWRRLLEYIHCIRRVPLGWHERTWCYLYVMKWAGKQLIRRFLKGTIKIVVKNGSRTSRCFDKQKEHVS